MYQFPTTKQKCSSYNSIKTSFLAVVIASVPFLFKFHETQVMLILILIAVQYSQNAVFTLKKVQIFKINPHQVLTTQ